ncbi:MAG TPA: serpin family protein [Pseudonocardiaceae bacterium]|nr:serpin family protein [Pseudonocardiaceae bacterium]
MASAVPACLPTGPGRNWRAGLAGQAAALAAVMLLAACGGASGVHKEPDEAGGHRMVIGVSRELPGGDVPVGQAVRGLTAFGHELYTVVADPAKNTVISPLSIGIAFGMARAGAGGQTASQLDQVFGFPPRLHAAFNDLDRKIVTGGPPPPRLPPNTTRKPGEPPAPPVVAIANGLFVQDGFAVKGDFLRILASQYGAGAELADFTSGRAADQINTWVRAATAERITKVFDQLDPGTRLVLANAVYLKADWQSPFSASTMSEPFTRLDGTVTAVPMMNQQAEFRYASGRGWQAVELPYARSELAMRVIVPQGAGGLAGLLSPATLSEIQAGLRPQRVDLFLPQWDFATDVNLLPALRKLGLNAVNGFPGISDAALELAAAVHRANITVDEWGTEAAAVTGLAMIVSAPAQPPVVVRADHPFAFEIVHRPTGAPLFIGHVADPLAR